MLTAGHFDIYLGVIQNRFVFRAIDASDLGSPAAGQSKQGDCCSRIPSLERYQ